MSSQPKNNDKNDDSFGESDDELSTKESPLSDLYEYATICVRNNATTMDKEDLLYLYARFKYVTNGPCNEPKPGFFNFEAKAKWDKWSKLGSKMSKDEAKQEYIAKLDKALPNWRDGYSAKTRPSQAEQKGTFGIRMSMMAKGDEKPLEETDLETSCYELSKEDDKLDKLKEYIDKNKNKLDSILNEVDESQMTMLMWACDRGNLDLVKYLVELGSDLNMQDADGQTCLHFAVSCEHLDVVKYLVSTKKVDVNKEDNDGTKAIDITENEEIKEILANA